MRRFAPFLVTFSALIPAVVPVAPPGARGEVPEARVAPASISDARIVPAGELRTGCRAPGTLRLRRFEDGSAQLLCAGRVLVRVSVPG